MHYATTREAAARQLPWDAMGSALSTNATTVEAALKESGLDYQVETWDANAARRVEEDNTGGHGTVRPVVKAPTHQAIVRPMPDGSKKVLAFTKKRYTPIQNQEAFAPADYLVSEFGARITGAADYRNGDRSLLAVQLPEGMDLKARDGVDRVDLNLLIINDHAGNAALTLALTPMRVACTNAIPAALRGAERVWKISHTPKAQARLDLAAEAIKKALDYRDAFQEKAQAMLDQEMVDAEFSKLVAKLYPVKKDAEGVAAERKRTLHADLLNLWKESPTLDGIRGTRWAGYNVFTEYLDHYRPVRGDEAVARGEGALDGPYARQKAAIWNTFAAA